MNSRELLAVPALGALTLKRLLTGHKDPEGAFRILLLHDVPAEQEDALIGLLDRIGDLHGFLTSAQAEARLRGTDPVDADRVPFMLSFDDGFISNRRVALELLADRGLKALFFVCPGLIDLNPEEQQAAVRRNLFSRPPDKSVEALMDWDDLAALQESGHTIGAHTQSHARLAGFDPARLSEEIGADADRIAIMTGSRPDWFAYPFGDIASIDEPALRLIGQKFKFCRSGVRGINIPGEHRLSIHADHVDLANSPAWQRLVLSGGLDGRYRDARTRLAALAKAVSQPAAP